MQYLYDGNCKVCQTFKTTLDAQDNGKGNIDFINIAESSYDPRKHNDVQYDDAMTTIHAITAEGKTVKGVLCDELSGFVWQSIKHNSAGIDIMR